MVKNDLMWMSVYVISKIAQVAHIIASVIIAALGCFYILSTAVWPIPFWLVWITSVSYVSHQQLKFSFIKILTPAED